MSIARIYYTITLTFVSHCLLTAAPTSLFEEPPETITRLNDNTYLIDFGKVTFGNLLIESSHPNGQNLEIHFGEDFVKGRINRKPPGTIRYQFTSLNLKSGEPKLAAPPVNRRNTNIRLNAVLTPKEWGVVLPFRWVEIEGWEGELKPENVIRRSAYLSAWNDDAASFESSDELLNKIWNLSRDSIKATTFAGIYVDGDRERIPYEADAYLNQLSHYYTDQDIQMARDTYDYLMEYPTWPTEWASHMIFMVYADWMQTGDTAWISQQYEKLQTKLLINKVDENGLVKSSPDDINKNDIVDWPKNERDGFVFTAYNTVINAFHIRTLYMMSELATAIDNQEDANQWLKKADISKAAFNQLLYNKKLGGYVDGISTEHQSIHANLFPLAFGLVADEHQDEVTNFLKQRDMDCSVYAAQYLLEALYMNEADIKAYELMTADTDRSWKHMVDSNATITWEAWDMKYKPNQDWNHAWGAAPANILPRYVLGAEAKTPGWKSASIRPYLSGLSYAKGKIPTPNGSLSIHWQNKDKFQIIIESSEPILLHLALPARNGSRGVYSGDQKLALKKVDNRWVGDYLLDSKVLLTVK